jgi:hypothetical protein
MWRIVAIPLALTCACTPVLDESDGAVLEEPEAPERAAEPTIPEARVEQEAEPDEPVAEVDSVFVCTGADMHVAKFHHATLELQQGGTFELHFADVSDEGGRSLWMLGRWEAEPKAILLHPDSGLYREWSGDAHRHVHGEPSGFSLERDEGVYTHERRLPITVENRRITAIRIDEIATSVYPRRGEIAPRCDPSERNP